MPTYKLEAQTRNSSECGKGHARRLRRKGALPGNLIAQGKSTLISVPDKELETLIKSGLRSSSIIDLSITGGAKVQAIIKELQRHVVNNKVLHVDFYQITENKRLQVKIGVEPVGTAKGIKLGGALEHYIRNLQVRTTPESLKEVIEVDISNLNVGEALYLKDLNIPQEWDVIIEGNPIVLKIAQARVSTAAEETDDTKEATQEKAPGEGDTAS